MRPSASGLVLPGARGGPGRRLRGGRGAGGAAGLCSRPHAPARGHVGKAGTLARGRSRGHVSRPRARSGIGPAGGGCLRQGSRAQAQSAVPGRWSFRGPEHSLGAEKPPRFRRRGPAPSLCGEQRREGTATVGPRCARASLLPPVFRGTPSLTPRLCSCLFGERTVPLS